MSSSRPLRQRLDEKLDRSGACWIFTGAIATSGYGRIGLGKATLQAHRAAYELFVGPIPDGKHIDHLCRNRLCCNPEHLEPVSQAENNRRAGAFRRSQQTRCSRGHELTQENSMLTTRGTRQCRECHNMRNRARRRGMTAETFAILLERGVIA